MLRLIVISTLFTTIFCFECKDLGNGYFRDPIDCAKMIRCSNGVLTHRFSCSEGKVFNDITKSCDDPKFVNCQNSVTDTVTSPSSVTTDEPPNEEPISVRIQSLLSTPIPVLLDTLTTIRSRVSPTESLSTTTETATETATTESPISETTTVSTTTESSSVETTLTENSSPEMEVTESTSHQSIRNESLVKTNRKFLDLNESFVEYEDEKRITIPLNHSFVIYEEKTPISLNQSFVEYEDDIRITTTTTTTIVTERVKTDQKETTEQTETTNQTVTTDPSPTTDPMVITDRTTTTEETESTTIATSTPTSIRTDVSPVLESVLQNETLIDTTVSELSELLETTTPITTSTTIQTTIQSTTQTTTSTTEAPTTTTEKPTTTAKSRPYCGIDESSVGFRMISSNYSTNETSKLKDFYKVVCYFTNWSRYRSGSGKYTPQHVNPYLCTHLIYAFATLDNETLTMKPSDECTDIDNKFYEQITGLKEKNPRLKVLIALGGWVDSQGDKYSRLVNNQTNRLNFIENAVQFLKTHNFDGLDLDWEYPKCWQADCSAGPASDKLNFGLLIRELRIAFNKESRPLLLTAAVGATQYVGDNAYEFNSLMINLDFINLMTYDYYTAGSSMAAHHSPLYSHPNAKDLYHSVSNANFSINYWMRKGVPSHKLVLGIPFYGRSFKLIDLMANDFGSAVNGTGHKGNYTQENGFLAYYEICTNLLRNGWAKRTDTYVRKGKQLMTGPYAYHADQWVGYDDRDHILQKTEFIKDNGLGGAMIWALDLDDFNGICCKTKSPLLKTINKELREYPFDLKFFCP